MRPGTIVQAALALVLVSTVSGQPAFAEDGKAQAAPKAYVLSEIAPRDREVYIEYLRNVLPIIERHGGRVVVNPFEPKVLIEGRPLEGNLAMIEFPSAEARDAFWNSPEYQPWKARREASATSRIIHIN
ncbi:DUF1330 domain-containing protein [Qipengyuania flava]|uniref:DUF1330 domain-containing protein n=1 Tax=Qipengyuania flava TaxID=192812 RepID=UPI001C62E5D8|nr:DUF1330 domain-containing protein [Qipengyuania flava]QYJ08093.1 DUF1330 domain-containing protein [Qipengyuania flava]